jgi:hypothetical protein
MDKSFAGEKTTDQIGLTPDAICQPNLNFYRVQYCITRECVLNCYIT